MNRYKFYSFDSGENSGLSENSRIAWESGGQCRFESTSPECNSLKNWWISLGDFRQLIGPMDHHESKEKSQWGDYFIYSKVVKCSRLAGTLRRKEKELLQKKLKMISIALF